MAFDEEGQAATLERRLSILLRAPGSSSKGRLCSEDIILDPNIFAVGTGIDEHRRYALDFFEATRLLKERLPGCLVPAGCPTCPSPSGGTTPCAGPCTRSSSTTPRRRAWTWASSIRPARRLRRDRAFLRERIEDLLFDRRPDATERLLEAASRHGRDRGGRRGAAKPSGGPRPPGSASKHALVNGISEWAAADAEEARRLYGREGPRRRHRSHSGPLMEGMNKVGDLFGAGKMFLPQVVKSARVMKAAVGAILPYLKDGRVGLLARQDRHRHGEGRRPRHRQEHRLGRAAVQRLRDSRPRRDDALRGHPGRGGARGRRSRWASPASSRPRSRR